LITFSCPTCNKKLKVASVTPGAKVKCPGCAAAITVPEVDTDTAEASAVAAGTPPAKKAASAVQSKPVVAKVDGAAKKSTPPPKGRTKPQRDDDEDDDDDDEEEAPSRMGLWIGLGAGAAALAIGAVILVLALGGDKDTSPKVAKPDDTPKPRRTSPPPRIAPAVKPTVAAVEDETPKQELEAQELFVQPKAKPESQEIREHLLKSAALVWGGTQEAVTSWGSGSLVDRQNKLVLTNYHVVANRVKFEVFFPTRGKNGELLASKDDYFKDFVNAKREAYWGRVLKHDSRRDLALIQLDKLPPTVQAIPVGEGSVKGGESVWSMGNAGASGGLWRFVPGTVNNVTRQKYKTIGEGAGFDVDAQVVETNSLINPGDSGGALVNDRGELVGVTQGSSPLAQGVSLFIDIQEVREFVNETCRNNSLTWARNTQPLHAAIKVDVLKLMKYLESSSPKVRAKALELLAEMGPRAQPAVRALVEVLKDKDEPTSRRAQKALENIGVPDKADVAYLKTALQDRNERVRIYAADALGRLGLDARSTVPELVKALSDALPPVRQNAAQALGQIGPEAKAISLPALTKALKDDEKAVRMAAAESLILVLTPLSAGDLTLVSEQLLAHKDIECRLPAVRALGTLKSEHAKVVPLLKEFCKSGTDKPLRLAALSSLAQFGPDAEPAIALLIETAKDMDGELRQAAFLAIGKMGAKAKAALPVLTEALKDSDKIVKASVINALGGIGPDAAKATAAELGQLLEDEKDRGVRLQIVMTLGKYGPGAKPAAARMIEAFAEEELEKAIGLLGKIDDLIRDPVSKIKIELELTKILAKVDKTFQEKDVEALSKIGKPAVPYLIQGLRDQRAFVRWGCVKALSRMGPQAKDAWTALSYNARLEPIPDIRKDTANAAHRVAQKR
jgi:HEAT repeat protein/S1-C subfamily serine protease